jgi:hypothetical protein
VYRTLFAPVADTVQEGHEAAVMQVEGILDLLGDARVNKYLVYGILETVVVRLVPEMQVKTPAELLEERGVNVEGVEEGEGEDTWDRVVERNGG